MSIETVMDVQDIKSKEPMTLEMVVKNYDMETTEEKIAELKAKYAGYVINGVDDKAGYDKTHEARMVVKNLRVTVEKRRKAFSGLKTSIDKKAEKLTNLLLEVEKPLEATQGAIDLAKQKIKQQAQDRVDMLLKYGKSIAYDVARKMVQEEWEEELKEAKGSWEANQAKIAVGNERLAKYNAIETFARFEDLVDQSEEDFEAEYKVALRLYEDKKEELAEIAKQKDRQRKMADYGVYEINPLWDDEEWEMNYEWAKLGQARGNILRRFDPNHLYTNRELGVMRVETYDKIKERLETGCARIGRITQLHADDENIYSFDDLCDMSEEKYHEILNQGASQTGQVIDIKPMVRNYPADYDVIPADPVHGEAPMFTEETDSELFRKLALEIEEVYLPEMADARNNIVVDQVGKYLKQLAEKVRAKI